MGRRVSDRLMCAPRLPAAHVRRRLAWGPLGNGTRNDSAGSTHWGACEEVPQHIRAGPPARPKVATLLDCPLVPAPAVDRPSPPSNGSSFEHSPVAPSWPASRLALHQPPTAPPVAPETRGCGRWPSRPLELSQPSAPRPRRHLARTPCRWRLDASVLAVIVAHAGGLRD